MITSVRDTHPVSYAPKQDPFQKIPLEITVLILRSLPLLYLVRASETCREWNQIIDGNKKTLWVPWALALHSFLTPGMFIPPMNARICIASHGNSPFKKMEKTAHAIHVDGKTYLRRVSAIRKELLSDPESIDDNLVGQENELIANIEFAFSQIGLISYQRFLDTSKKYMRASFKTPKMNPYQIRFITDRITALAKARLFDQPLKQFSDCVKDCGIHPCDLVSGESLKQLQIILEFCDKNRVHEAIDFIEKKEVLVFQKTFHICLLSILEKLIQLNDRETIWKLSCFASKAQKRDYLRRNTRALTRGGCIVQLSSEPIKFNECTDKDPKQLRKLITQLENITHKPTKFNFDLYKLFKDDPTIQEPFNNDKLFPFGSLTRFLSYYDLIVFLVGEGCDDEAIELYKILPLSRYDQIMCLRSMAALFRAKGLDKKAEMVLALKPKDTDNSDVSSSLNS
jgi:hypothetical protein